MVKHEIRVDLSGADLDTLVSDDDFRREAERILPAALEELGQALGEAAWERRQTIDDGPAIEDEMREFVVKAGRTYRRFAPARDRKTLTDLIVRKLQQAKDQSAARTADDMGSTVPAASDERPVGSP